MGKGKVTPIQIAFIVERFLADNNYPTTLAAFRSEASDLFSKMKAKAVPKGLLGLGEILDEYISLKEQRIMVDQEKRRVEIAFQGLSDVMKAFSSPQSPTLLQQNPNGGSPPQGITGIQRHVIVAIWCSIRLEVPLGQVGSIMVSQEFAWYLVGIANEKVEANRKRSDGLLHILQSKVASATTTFVMLFSSSLSVIEFYFLNRFPIPYALYLISVSLLAGFWGQFFVRKLVKFLKRASIIIFILSAVIFASALWFTALGNMPAVY